VAGGGGPSACAAGSPSISGVVSGSCKGWPKPSWQSVVGNPNDGVRDTPDLSLFAADGLWSHFYIFCWSDIANGGAACTGAPGGWSGAGGTSFASPIMAGIQALVNQKTGSRQGNPNPVYYQLAASEYGSSGSSTCNSSNGNAISSACIFNDVTVGDIDVNCARKHNCYFDGAASGVLSTSNSAYKPAYGTNTGWDFATGIGTVNAANLVNNWPGTSGTPSFTLSASPASVTIMQGSNGASTITVIPSDGFNGMVSLSASGLPSGVNASFNANSTATTSTLTLSATSTAATGTITVTITGTSGTLTSTATLSLTVNAAPAPSFTLSASPNTVTVIQGAAGASTISVTPQNNFSGNVSLSASGLPTGVTASFNPASTASTSTLTLTASGTAMTGTVTVTITGTSGSLSGATTLSLRVNAAPIPNFTLSASPNALTVEQSATSTSTISVSPQSGFSGNVSLSASGLPSGVTASFNPASTASSSTLTLTASDSAATGMVTVTITGTSGGLTNTTTLSLTVNALPPGTLPSPWVDGDIGAIGVAGNATYNSGTFTVSGAGAMIYGSSDAFNFVYQPMTGDGSIVARLVSWQGALGPYAAAGVMIRNTLDPAAANAKTADWPSYNTIYFDVRPTASNSTNETAGVAATLPYWIKVVRSGNAFFSYTSPDGVNWTQVGTVQTVVMGQSVYIGLAVSSGSTAALATATFDNVTVGNTPQPVPSPWVDADVGTVGLAGNASYTNGTFTVNGSGTLIYGSADAFNFVYQPLTGDGTIVARLVSFQQTTPEAYAAAGVMIRDTLDPAAANAKTADWPYYKSVYFDVRDAAGSGTNEVGGVPATLPYWIKVTRSGSTFSSYASADGVNWVQVGTSQSFTMGQTVNIGLVVTNGSTTSLASATFDNVSITNP
jgi:hypothetical protein